MHNRPKSPNSPSWGPYTAFHTVKWLVAITLAGGIFLFFFTSAPRSYYSSFESSSSSPCDSLDIYNSLLLSEKIYNEHKLKREEKVKSKPREVKPWAPHVFPYDYFVATFGCPFSIQRLGALGDGGKWTCGIERYEKSPCVLYSFGIAGEASFEIEMMQKTSCEVFAFDASVSEVAGVPEELKSRINFSQQFAGRENKANYTTLGAAMAKNGHKHVDIIKMDIEMNEFSVLDQVIAEFGNNNLPFSQLLIEIHVNIIDGVGFTRLYDFFTKLENAGLRPFRNEINLSPMILSHNYVSALSEYSFINVNHPC